MMTCSSTERRHLKGSLETALKGEIMGAVESNTSGSVMVVGAGIAGMQSALDLAESGYYVYLVERSPAIGGLMAQLDKTFPTNDCTM
jgi:heterodisulfide reductase subunit A